MDLEKAIASSEFVAAAKVLDKELRSAAGSDQDKAEILCNRGFCYQQAGLLRKALKDFLEACKLNESNIRAAVGQGEVLHLLKRREEAKASWQHAASHVRPTSDISMAFRAAALLKDADGLMLRPSSAVSLPAAVPSAPAANGHPYAVDMSRAHQSPQAKDTTSGFTLIEEAGSAENDLPASSSSSARVKGHHSFPGSSAVSGASDMQQRNGHSSVRDMQKSVEQQSAAVSLAVAQINAGKIQEAEDLLDAVLNGGGRTPNLGAYVARGTARALQRKLEGAVSDFSEAINQMPTYADGWKRRGQARAALEQHADALEDLLKARELQKLSPLPGSPPETGEIEVELGILHQKMRNFRRAVVELQKATKLGPKNAQAWNLRGQCHTSLGDIAEGVKCYEQAVKLQLGLREAWINMGIAEKEAAHVKQAKRALLQGTSLDTPASPSLHGMRTLAHMWQGCGAHPRAIEVLTKALAKDRPELQVELLFLRGACQHALGHHREAARDYEKALLAETPEKAGEETRSQQFLSFYQKELALYAYSHLDLAVRGYSLDQEISPLFKEHWCKKGPPTQEFLMHYSLQPSLKAGSGTRERPPQPEVAAVAWLCKAADAIGTRMQYSHQGFLPNVRQQRAGGLAAIELAQTLRKLISCQSTGEDIIVREGASGIQDAHPFKWRDAMDIIVKWRQLAEPNDQVIWVDLLTKREFEAGFGSHTPMFSGQTKCVRYYMNFERALRVMKDVLLKEGKAFDAANNPVPMAGDAKQSQVQDAQTAEHMWQALQVDSWVVVPILSSARPGHVMEGTRLTVVRVRDMPDAYEFSIRTPVTPARWQDFAEELDAVWQAAVDAIGSQSKERAAEAILKYAYYWYNFMPLARGSAMVGYTTILSLFLAAGMPISAAIPKDYQVDWEAILESNPSKFVSAIGSWLYPPAAKGQPSTPAPSSQYPDPETLPAVADVLITTRHRLEALNGPDHPRL
ncbi:hypothetical protein WJX74_003734 [Apatococcus lobatus]|uniref:Uncharacterized protein n=1 Tax=Apatococcus lobatus TaxID=904363 RepID=A0AAW1SAM2_9CHLO